MANMSIDNIEMDKNVMDKNDLKDILSKKVDTDTIKDVNKDITETDVELTKKEYVPSDDMKNLMQMMDDESKDIVNKSWSKINRSTKSQLLENFIEKEIEDKELDEKQGRTLKVLLTKALNSNLLNKQSDIKYDNVQNTILEICILKYDEETKKYEIVTKDNKVKVVPKTRSKTNIDKLLNSSKKKR